MRISLIFVLFLLVSLPFSSAATYYYAGSRLMAQKNSGELSYVHLDRLGTEISSDSLPFGQVLFAGSRFGFTGKEFDQSKLYYFAARYFDTDTARFTSIDAVEMMFPYQYAHNDPANLVDPTGNAVGDPIQGRSGYVENIHGAPVEQGLFDAWSVRKAEYDVRAANPGVWDRAIGWVEQDPYIDKDSHAALERWLGAQLAGEFPAMYENPENALSAVWGRMGPLEKSAFAATAIVFVITTVAGPTAIAKQGSANLLAKKNYVTTHYASSVPQRKFGFWPEQVPSSRKSANTLWKAFNEGASITQQRAIWQLGPLRFQSSSYPFGEPVRLTFRAAKTIVEREIPVSSLRDALQQPFTSSQKVYPGAYKHVGKDVTVYVSDRPGMGSNTGFQTVDKPRILDVVRNP